MKRLLVAASAVLALSMAFSSQASAQHYGCSSGYGGHGHRTWHDTSHYDYHAPSLVPHRGHYDYVPGHYHRHQTGHWDHYSH